jgi:hypothetical protein
MRPAVSLALGGLIGLAVLAAVMRPAGGSDLPPRQRHQLHQGRAQLNLPPGSSSVFLFDERLWPTEAWAPAARDAVESGRWAGAGAGVVSAVLPGPVGAPLPTTVRVAAREPELEPADDHAVDLDLLIDEALVVAGTGAVAADFIDVPPGAYRVRIAGQGYRVAHGASRLRIDLWPRRTEKAPRVRRRWPGWMPRRAGS